jgi:hypothetical protein
MEEFFAPLILALAEQIEVIIAENLSFSSSTANRKTDFSKIRVFNNDLENYYGNIRKDLPRAMHS